MQQTVRVVLVAFCAAIGVTRLIGTIPKAVIELGAIAVAIGDGGEIAVCVVFVVFGYASTGGEARQFDLIVVAKFGVGVVWEGDAARIAFVLVI